MKILINPRTFKLTALTLGAFCLASLSSAQTSSSNSGTAGSPDSRRNSDVNTSTPGASSLSSGDRRFLEKAAKDNMQEIAVARIAAQQATDPSVKSYAQQLLADHEAAAAKLTTLAASKGFTPPMDTKESHHAMSLEKKSGAEFDKEFVDMMVGDHKDTVAMFQKASKKSDDPAVAAFASELLPKLQQHEMMAKDLKSTLKK